MSSIKQITDVEFAHTSGPEGIISNQLNKKYI